MKHPGTFITMEGGEGTGKTTVIGKIGEYFERLSVPYMMTREPGGIEIAEKIREIILNPSHTAMDARTEALLYAASRRQHFAEKVEPALNKGLTVICDRYVDSSLAYQGYARGLGMDEVWNINQFAIGNRLPDLTFYLDLDPQIGLDRIAANQGREVNRLDMEALSFHQKVREGYHLIAAKFPERIAMIDASKDPDAVEQDIISLLRERI